MWLSIQGISEYDPTVFDGFDSPSYTDPNNNVHVLNKNDVINSICLECAELELLYPSVEMMKFAIGVWSASNYDSFCKMYASQLIKYNPIWNVDAEIEHTNRVAGSDNRSVQKYNTTTPNTTNEHSVQGFNSDTWSQTEKDVLTGTVQDNGSITDNNTDDHTETFHERRTGNIGVTASQDLIKKEREIADFSTIEFITKSFKERFCLLVY